MIMFVDDFGNLGEQRERVAIARGNRMTTARLLECLREKQQVFLTHRRQKKRQMQSI